MVWDNIPFNLEDDPERRRTKQQVIQHADKFLVYTERSVRTLDIEGVPSDRIVKLNPGVDVEKFSPGEGDRRALGINEDEFVILFVGWLIPRKGIDFLVLALRELLHDPALAGRRPRLFIVGAQPGRDRVERLAARLDVAVACTFAGTYPYNEMPNVFRAADTFVLPSIAMPDWQEQFGMSLIESMACGVPTISTYSGAIPEIAGDAACLVQPNDFLSLYAALRELMLDPSKRQDLSAAARTRACDNFDLKKHVHALAQVYDELIS